MKSEIINIENYKYISVILDSYSKENKIDKGTKIYHSQLSPELIKRWLISHYKPGKKHTFISITQLYAEFYNYTWITEENIYINFDNANLEFQHRASKLYLFWMRLRNILKKLEWDVKEDFLLLNENKERHFEERKIPGIFHLIRTQEDSPQEIHEIPLSKQLTYEERSFAKEMTNYSYFYDVGLVEERILDANLESEFFPKHEYEFDEYSEPTRSSPHEYWENTLSELKAVYLEDRKALKQKRKEIWEKNKKIAANLKILKQELKNGNKPLAIIQNTLENLIKHKKSKKEHLSIYKALAKYETLTASSTKKEKTKISVKIYKYVLDKLGCLYYKKNIKYQALTIFIEKLKKRKLILK